MQHLRSEEELEEIANQITTEMVRNVNAKKSEDTFPGASAEGQSEDEGETGDA